MAPMRPACALDAAPSRVKVRPRRHLRKGEGAGCDRFAPLGPTGNEPTLACRIDTVRCLSPAGFHRMTYRDWGAAGAPAVLCVHGLTRNGRDFDRLAAALEGDRRVLAPDIVGRGASDRLPSGDGYALAQYASDVTALMARLRRDSVDWVGTSMGGLLGIVLAAQPGTPIRRLVVNDVGPVVPQAALERIGHYVGVDWRFDTFAEAEAHIRAAYAPFGLTEDADWRFLTEISVAERPDGGYGPNYDLKIAEPFRDGTAAPVDLWAYWERIACPVLVLRGAESDLLDADTAAAMAERAPRATVVEVPGVGHAPALMDAWQIGLVKDWLLD